MYIMEKPSLFVFYNMFMMSLYLHFNAIRPFVLFTLSIVYISVFVYIILNFDTLFGECNTETSDNLSLIAWQCLWGLVVCIFIGRDLHIINDLGILSAFILFFVLMFTTITSCYVILMDSRHWISQLFMTSALYWILFHDCKSWVSSTPYVLCIPICVMFMLRIIYYIETNKHVEYAIIEGILFVVFIVTEIAQISHSISNQTVGIIFSIGFFLILFFQNSKFINGILFSGTITIPLIWIYFIYNIVLNGWALGISITENKISSFWRKWTGEEIKLLKIMKHEGIISNDLFDDTL